jgi:AAA15 family ATPase/GTPase
MRIETFQIRNFKSIIDTGKCHLSDTNNVLVLAGQNEAGKSAVIEALDFFGNGLSEHFERLHRRQEKHPEVVCEFLLESPEIEAIYQTTKNEKLKKYFEKNYVVGFIRGDVDEDSFEDTYFTEETTEKLGKFFPEKKEEDKKDNTPENQSATKEESDNENKDVSITNLDELEQFLFGKVREFTFFDSFDALLPGVVPVGEIGKYPAVLDFEKVFNVKFVEVAKKNERAISREEQRLHREASDNLNTYWTQKLDQGSKYNFSIKIVPQPAENLSKIEFKIDRDDGDPLFMEQKSKGFRWFSAFNLRLRALGVEKDTIKNLVILIDEPGQGLHEKAQRDVKRVIEELANDGAQIIYTTHHPNLIGTEGKEFARIRVVSNTKDIGTKVETVAQYASRADQGAKDSLSPLITAMGIHSVGSLLDTKRLNVVVEGISDHYYLTAFRKLLNKNEQLYFLPACGVNNVPNLVSILIGWGFNYKAVFDDDAKSGRATYNLLKKEFYENNDDLAHRYIHKIKDCDGIEDILSPKDFYKFVLNKTFPKEGAKEKNSKLAADKKELLARLFLERAENNEVELNQTSISKIDEVFKWLYEKFDITT